MYFNNLSDCSRTGAKSQMAGAVFYRTDSYMMGYTTPFMVEFLNKEGDVVKTLSTFAMWNHQVEEYLEVTPDGYSVDSKEHLFAYALDYLSMHNATCLGKNLNNVPLWNKCLLSPSKVAKDPHEGFYLESVGSQIEVIFCEQEITSWRTVVNPNHDPSAYENDNDEV